MTHIIIAGDARLQLIRHLHALPADTRVFVLADPDTLAACGADVLTELERNINININLLESKPKPKYSLAESLAERLKSHDILLTIGSGSITDLGKYCSYHTGKEHLSIGTAASMNGYLSATSSLLEDGHKHSFSTKTPDYLYLDINILNYASSCLTSAGIGDTLCRSTVQTDLQLAALFQDVDLAQKLLAEVEVEERNLIASESVNMEALVKALLASGRAMTQAGSSAPASQSEHMIAHALEAMYPERCSDLLHGSVIAVTTLTASRHQEAVLASGTLQLQPLITLDALSDAIGKEAMARLYPDYLNKYHQLETALAGIDWPAQKPAMTGRLSTAELEYHLKRFGCPTTPQELGFSDGEYQAAVSIARATRERITALDFV